MYTVLIHIYNVYKIQMINWYLYIGKIIDMSGREDEEIKRRMRLSLNKWTPFYLLNEIKMPLYPKRGVVNRCVLPAISKIAFNFVLKSNHALYRLRFKCTHCGLFERFVRSINIIIESWKCLFKHRHFINPSSRHNTLRSKVCKIYFLLKLSK